MLSVPSPVRETLLAVVFVSAIPLAVLVLLARREDAVRRAVPGFVCFAVGALLGAAFFQLMPEAYEGAHGRPRRGARSRRRTLVTLNLVGDATHNLLDGVLIAATFLSNPAVGVLTTVAVSLHEIPHELGSFGVFVHGGVAVRRAVLYNVGTALVSLGGAALTLAVGTHAAGVARAFLPFAAGNFLYIAASLLVPLLRRPGSRRAVAARMTLIALGLATTGVPALFR